MNPKNRNFRQAFTLLELVVVLAILAVVTALATREIGHVEDQQRFETSQCGLEEIEDAVLGSDQDRGPDGARVISGFVADLGRLPRTVVTPNLRGPGSTDLTLQELWSPAGMAPFDVRPASSANVVDNAFEDLQVLVPGGWRGPYVRLPLGAANLLDGWGNGYTSPPEPPPAETADTTGYARLRDGADEALTEAGHAIEIVRHLGANGRADAADSGYDRDEAIAFSGRFGASLKGSVEVLSGDGPATPDSTDTVTVRVFAPSPDNAALIAVYKTEVPFATNPVSFDLSAAAVPEAAALTMGPRVVRAYFTDNGAGGTTTYTKSGVKNVRLRAGVNQLDLTIDR